MDRCRIFIVAIVLGIFVRVDAHGEDALQAATLAMEEGTNYVVFKAEVNGKPVTVAIDTGADLSCLSVKHAGELGVAAKGKQAVKLKIGDLTFDHTVVVLNFGKTFHGWLQKADVQVVLGHDFVSQLTLVCDYPAKKVTFLRSDPQKSFDEIGEAAAKHIGEIKDPAVLEMRMMRSHVFVVAKVKGFDKDFYFGVDTGAVGDGETNFLTSVGLQELKVKKSAVVDIVVSGKEFGGVSMTKSAPGGVDKFAESMRKENKLFVAILGYAFFKSHKVIFDYKGSKLLLAK